MVFGIFNKISSSYLAFHQKQSGAASLLILLLIFLVASSVMFSSMTGTEIKTAKANKTNLALSQAKAAIIGWSVSQAASPGQLPCPENTASIGTINEGTANTSCTLPAIGRLPWKTLGVGDLRDGNGDRLWYVVSAGFRTSPINSETIPQLTVDGIANAAVAIVFSPGIAASTQTRPEPSSSSPPAVAQYLDSVNGLGGTNNSFISTSVDTNFNDKLLVINQRDLFSVVEKRVIREAKNCFDTYATGGNQRYPWAAPMTDLVSYTGVESTTFGRIPLVLTTTVSGTPIALMPTSWSTVSGCIFYPSTTWWNTNNWNQLVFYQVADGYKPQLAAAACNATCLYVTGNGNPNAGSGTYRAILAVAGKNILSEDRTNKTMVSNYLEGINAHTNPNPSLQFESYTYTDSQYSTVNDGVACIDGTVNCR